MYQNNPVCDASAITYAGAPSCVPSAAAACHTCVPPPKSGRRTALIWGISGTVLSAVGWIALMLFDQYNAGLAELRADLKHFNEVSAELVKKETMRKMVEHLKDSYKELQASMSAREMQDRELKASEKSRRVLARELQKMRERLAAVEGRQAATAVLIPAPKPEQGEGPPEHLSTVKE
jgi:hypothetical protein